MAPDNDTPPTEEEYETTMSSKTRWTYIGTVLAAVVVTSLPLLVLGTAFGVFSLASISNPWLALYATVVLMGATWAFGEETLKAVRKVRGKD